MNNVELSVFGVSEKAEYEPVGVSSSEISPLERKRSQKILRLGTITFVVMTCLVGLIYLISTPLTEIHSTHDESRHFIPTDAEKILLTDHHGVCNDGSRAGYYLREGVNHSKWIFYLEDQTGYCWDQVSCDYRNATLPHLMSSDSRPDTISSEDYQGILSPDPHTNPAFYDANIVHIKYCSSDFFVGMATQQDLGYYFRGHYIIQSTVEEVMLRNPLFQDAEQVLIFGAGRGSIGLSFTIDSIRDKLIELGIIRGHIR